jgi:hypothetical protein
MQCARAILPSVADPDLQYFSPLSHKRHEFRKNVIEHKRCVFFALQPLSETFLILRRTERDMIKMHISLHVKYSISLSDFNESLIF